jgi:hypothetical protein
LTAGSCLLFFLHQFHLLHESILHAFHLVYKFQFYLTAERLV